MSTTSRTMRYKGGKDGAGVIWRDSPLSSKEGCRRSSPFDFVDFVAERIGAAVVRTESIVYPRLL